MLLPQVAPPFPLAWGFSTRLDDAASLPRPQLSQVHGCGVVEATGAVQEGDGIWTMASGVRIGVRVADCVPILLAGQLPSGPWISALHAGWRGATAGILRRGVAIYVEAGGDPAELAWALGPAIQACHFEVGEEVIDAAKADAAWHDGLRREGPRGRPHLDLQGFLKAQAADLGLDPRKDGSVGLCTLCQRDLLWSYRGGDTKARQWGWVEIVG
ncbi:MAG TPA: polyphenol oxidase family protein [Holophagaceae bacterium]|nr:polyphenol oxidase family protein [Holophagaceae bacterium]